MKLSQMSTACALLLSKSPLGSRHLQQRLDGQSAPVQDMHADQSWALLYWQRKQLKELRQQLDTCQAAETEPRMLYKQVPCK